MRYVVGTRIIAAILFIPIALTLEPDATARQRDGVIARAGPGYVLRLPPEAVDAWAFEAALEEVRRTQVPWLAANLPRTRKLVNVVGYAVEEFATVVEAGTIQRRLARTARCEMNAGRPIRSV